MDGDGLSEIVALFILADETKMVKNLLLIFSKIIINHGQKHIIN